MGAKPPPLEAAAAAAAAKAGEPRRGDVAIGSVGDVVIGSVGDGAGTAEGEEAVVALVFVVVPLVP